MIWQVEKSDKKTRRFKAKRGKILTEEDAIIKSYILEKENNGEGLSILKHESLMLSTI